MASPRRSAAAALNVTRRHRGNDDPEIPRLEQNLRVAQAEEIIREIVANAPPISAAQHDRLAALLGAATWAPAPGRFASRRATDSEPAAS